MDVQAILAEVDRDGDGHIDYDEFVAMMMKVRACLPQPTLYIRHVCRQQPDGNLSLDAMPPTQTRTMITMFGTFWPNEPHPQAGIVTTYLQVCRVHLHVYFVWCSTAYPAAIDSLSCCLLQYTRGALLQRPARLWHIMLATLLRNGSQGNEEVLHSKSTMRRGPVRKAVALA